MPTKEEFNLIFKTMRAVLKKYEKRCDVDVNSRTEYFINLRGRDKKGKPRYFAGTGINLSTVSFYLIPIHRFAVLHRSISPELRAHLHGHCCFRFKKIEPKLLKELAILTKKAFKRCQARN